MGYLRPKVEIARVLFAASMLLVWPLPASAQLRPVADDTLGSESSVVVPLGPDSPIDQIEGGALRGNNLFHSFSEFHVDERRSVYFTDPGVENILTRVTGNSASQILSLIDVLGNANLFLINPNGIVFGDNARFLGGGSLTATTANAIAFEQQGLFNASDPAVPALLSVQPSAFLFNQINPAPIVNQAKPLPPSIADAPFRRGLRVSDGQSLILLGGNISFDEGSLSALGGRIEVGGLSEPGTVLLNADGSLSFPEDKAQANISIASGSLINASDSTNSGGSVTLTADQLEIANSGISAGTIGGTRFENGKSGDITLSANDIQVTRSGVDNVVRGFSGNGGDIKITSNTLSLDNFSVVQSTLLGEGSTGKVLIDAGDHVDIDGSQVFSNIGGVDRSTVAVGDGGGIEIATPVLSLTDSSVQSITFGRGNAGNVIINAQNRVFLDFSGISSQVGSPDAKTVAVGNGGNIEITTPSLLIANGSTLLSRTLSQGDAGDVIIDVQNDVTFESSVIASNVEINNLGTVTTGNGGNIQITASSLIMDTTLLFADTQGQGNAGNVTINTRGEATFNGSGIFSSVSDFGADNIAVGNGGDIIITASSLSLTNGTLFRTRTLGQGNAGSVTLETQGGTNLSRSFIRSSIGSSNIDKVAVGDGGDIQIVASSLSMVDGSGLTTTTAGQGNAGNVIFEISDNTNLNNSTIFSDVGVNGSSIPTKGDGGDVRISTGSLLLNNRTGLITATAGQGDAGDVVIVARGNTVLDDSFIFSNVNEPTANAVGVGDAGSIEIATGALDLINGAQLQAATAGRGDAGDVTVQARDRVTIQGSSQRENKIFQSGIFTNTQENAQGLGGDVNIAANSVRLADGGAISTVTENRFSGGTVAVAANRFEAIDGGQIVTRTGGNGSAGDINLDIANQTTLAGEGLFEISGNQGTASGLFASTMRNSTGPGGTVRLATGELQVLDQARIEVGSQGSGTAGNIDLAANTVRLDSGRLTAETAAADGGNIALRNTDVLLLRNGSLISTTAGTDSASGNGGNIDIDANFIVSVPNENNDIRANAFSGSGGNVRIDSQGLFGIAPQSQDNPLTSDITASSEQGVQGTVDIATPEVDPEDGLTELPVAFVDTSDQITQTCSGNREGDDSKFIVTGRGGLPSNPTDTLVGDELLADWAVLDELEDGPETTLSTLPIPAPLVETKIVEARGWTRENGEIKLVAATPMTTDQASVACQ